MTGESIPIKVNTGDTIYAGCINLSSPIEMNVTNAIGNSEIDKIIESKKASIVNSPPTVTKKEDSKDRKSSDPKKSFTKYHSRYDWNESKWTTLEFCYRTQEQR